MRGSEAKERLRVFAAADTDWASCRTVSDFSVSIRVSEHTELQRSHLCRPCIFSHNSEGNGVDALVERSKEERRVSVQYHSLPAIAAQCYKVCSKPNHEDLTLEASVWVTDSGIWTRARQPSKIGKLVPRDGTRPDLQGGATRIVW
jgi:hypothetical protein